MTRRQFFLVPFAVQPNRKLELLESIYSRLARHLSPTCKKQVIGLVEKDYQELRRLLRTNG